MDNLIDTDFLVVGAGMTGASAAAYLAERGRVAILDMESHAGYHTTGRSAALFTELYGNGVIRALTRASRDFLFTPPTGFCDTPLVVPRPVLYFGRHDQQHALARFRSSDDIRRATRALSPTEVQAMLPVFRPGYIGGGVLESGAADIDVDAVLQGFLRLARARGASLHLDSAVTSLAFDGGRWIATTRGATFRARVVVNAAGAWGDELAALAGIAPVGLQSLRRTAVLIQAPYAQHPGAWPVAIDIDEEFYFKPDAGHLLLSPADEEPSPPCDAQPEELEVAIAADRFERATGAEVRQIHHRWAGLRVFAPDRSPVVGFEPTAPGFFWLVGQGGYGIQTAPALGRVAAALASQEDIPTDIAQQGVTMVMLARERFESPASVAAST
jgi:D-arginine dehydrogenase